VPVSGVIFNPTVFCGVLVLVLLLAVAERAAGFAQPPRCWSCWPGLPA
jgi:hypothetical protein